MHGGPVRFVGGMRYPARGGTFSGGPNLSWPLATLELRPDGLTLTPRWLARRFLPPVEIALGDLTAVETDFGMFSGGGIRFRLTGPADGTVFWARASTKAALVDALRSAGVEVK